MSARAATVRRQVAEAGASARGWWSGVFASAGVHGLAIAALGAVRVPVSAPPPSPVVVEVVDVPAPVAHDEPTPSPREPAAATTTTARRVAAPAATPAPRTELPAAEPVMEPNESASPVEPLVLTGTTLTNDTGSWSSRAGNGMAMTGPIRAGRGTGSRPRARSTRSAPTSRVETFVPPSSLSRRPRAPNLDAVLARNIPVAARSQGMGGESLVVARISSAGVVIAVTVLSESYPGFGAACRQTVIGSRWTPPLDGAGRAVGTQVRYRCQFHVTR